MSLSEDIQIYFKKYTNISKHGVDEFVRRSTKGTYKKGQYLIRSGDKPAMLVLVLSGCLMTYYVDEETNPHVLQFGTDFWWTGDLEAFTNGSSSMYSIRAIVDTEIMKLGVDDFEYLCEHQSGFEKLFRLIFQNALVSHQKRIMNNISSSAEERYRSFQENYPKIELTVPQKYIASYLGITPEFLSKLRARRT